jgi:glucose-6-phosphate dehydrogenase assembly protein OpcA
LIEDASIRDVERELARLREESTDTDHSPSLRTSVMTHMAWVPEPWQEAAERTLGGLAERHPSRTIMLFPKPDEGRDELDADVDLRCFTGTSGPLGVCVEVVTLHLCGALAEHPASIVTPLLISDLPAFLRWRGALPHGAPELEQLVEVADRLIVDSAEWDEPADGLAELPQLFDRIAVSDIAWERTEPWRRALAGLWPGIAELDTLAVTGPRAESLLLAGWLSGRLGRDVALEHTEAAELEAVEPDGTAVEPAFLDVLSPSDLLSDQLEVFGRDRTYEEAVRSFSKVSS